MANGYKLYQRCPSCKGTGKRTVYGNGSTSEITCQECQGDGLVFWGWCTEDVYPMPDIITDPSG